jgi:hypothetical protein
MVGDLALDLQVIETLPLVQCVWIHRTSALLVTWQKVAAIGVGRRLVLVRRVVVAALRIVCRIIVRVVYEALLLKEVAAARLSRLIHLRVVLLEGVILNVDLALITPTLVVLQELLNHADEAHELAAFDLLRVEVVGFRYVEVGNNVVSRPRKQHVAVEYDVVVELLVASLLEVVHDRQLWWGVLNH